MSVRKPERALTLLEDTLAAFELELNPDKTAIYELPQELDNPGIQELRKFEFRTQYVAERSDLLQFFTRAFELQRKFPEKAILRYAVSRSAPDAINTANVALTQALILQAVTYEPGYGQWRFINFAGSTSAILEKTMAASAMLFMR